MSKFPQAVFLAGGNETSDDCEGHAFTSRMVNDDDELQAAQDQGWHLSVAAMVDAVKAAKLAEQPADNDDHEPPTRAELEQKAAELGIEFSPRLGDQKLAERIAAKLAEQGA